MGGEVVTPQEDLWLLLLLLSSLPSPFFLKGVWGPPLVSDSWPRTTAVAPPSPGAAAF